MSVATGQPPMTTKKKKKVEDEAKTANHTYTSKNHRQHNTVDCEAPIM